MRNTVHNRMTSHRLQQVPAKLAAVLAGARPSRRNGAGMSDSTEKHMKAAVSSEQGLQIKDIPQPKPKPFEILVRVRAASLNRADLNAARGTGAHGAMGNVVGLDWAGEVVEVGNECKGGFKPGDRVMCAGAGGYAEYAVVDWGRVVPIPQNMTFEHAATLPVAVATMHDALVTNGKLKPGDSVMIQGASSGVGLMALQIAKHLGAKLVIGTSTNAERRARLKSSAPILPSTPATRPGPMKSSRPPMAKVSTSLSIRCPAASPTAT